MKFNAPQRILLFRSGFWGESFSFCSPPRFGGFSLEKKLLTKFAKNHVNPSFHNYMPEDA